MLFRSLDRHLTVTASVVAGCGHGQVPVEKGRRRLRQGGAGVEIAGGFFSARRKGGTDASTFISGIDIGRIVDPADAGFPQHGADIRAAAGQQRSQQPVPAQQKNRGRHAGKAGIVRRGVAGSPHRDGLGLVVGGVGGQDGIRPEFVGSLAQKTVACFPRRGRQSARRLFAAPDLGDMGDAETSTQRGDGARFRGGGGSQRMIDRDGRQGNVGMATGAQGLMKQDEEAGGITAAGNGDEQMRGAVNGGQQRIDGDLRRKVGGQRATGRNQQLRRFCSEATLLITAREALGYRLLTSRSVAQAVSRLSRAASDMPSFSSISGAFGDLP